MFTPRILLLHYLFLNLVTCTTSTRILHAAVLNSSKLINRSTRADYATTVSALPKKVAELLLPKLLSCASRFRHNYYHHRTPAAAAFISTHSICNTHHHYNHNNNIIISRPPPPSSSSSSRVVPFIQREKITTTIATMTTKANADDNDIDETNVIPHQIIMVDQISSILQDSIQTIESEGTNNNTNKEVTTKIIHQAIDILQRLQSEANSICAEESIEDDVLPSKKDKEEKSLPSLSSSPLLQSLAHAAISSLHALDQLVQRVNQSKNKGSRKSSGQAWKALENVVTSTFLPVDADVHDVSVSGSSNDFSKSNNHEIARALALLTAGIALSMDCTDDEGNSSTNKMVASAIIPSDRVHMLQQHGKKFQLKEDIKQQKQQQHGKKYMKGENSKKVTCSGVDGGDGDSNEDMRVQTVIHSMARNALLGLLTLAVDTMKNGTATSVDLQIVAKLESGFSVGDMGRTLNTESEDEELAKAVANVVDVVFRKSSSSNNNDNKGDCDGSMEDDNYGYGDGGELISKDLIAPTFSLVANTRPWEYVQVEKLVTCAAELDLWYSAELLCDAAIASTTHDEKKVMMATNLPKISTTEELLTEDPATVTSIPRDSIGHLAAAAIIDITFDYRLYRRADAFASKYYAFGGPARFAEARFLHACDTITKVVKRRVVQVIDKQIDRVDASVARVSKDLNLTVSSSTSNNADSKDQRDLLYDGEDVAIENMSESIRRYALRSLRLANQHAAAHRLAKLWEMEYAHDPMLMTEELEERKRLFVQWDDEGCPGNSSDDAAGGGGGARPLPELIAEPADLLEKFCVLENNLYVGFDCEWHDSIKGVALLQLSTVTDSLLLDIPALTATKEGCDALKATVEKLFTKPKVLGIKHVIGFGCKDDIKRLRISPCVATTAKSHWFPQDQRCTFEDLRNLVRERNPQLSGKGGLHFGLSRACEMFLDKQLDKCEQCSDWLARPLSAEQREYAALDAWSCAAIGKKIYEGEGQVKAKEEDGVMVLTK